MLVSLFALALPALALASSTHSEDRRHARRAELRALRKPGGPVQYIEPPHAAGNGTEHGGEQANVAYSKNWSGVVLQKPPGGGKFKEVQGTIHVPHPKVPSGGKKGKKYSASAWVGIDGDTCGSAILQTGVDFAVHAGKVSYDHWYEWYPAYAYQYTSSLAIKAGDKITMRVTAASETKGTAEIINHRNGKKSVKHLTSKHHLCLKNAEWIVEDFESGGGLVPFASWKGAVAFTDATAKTGKGTYGPEASSAVVIDIKQGKKVKTSVSRGKSSLSVRHT